MAKTTTLTLADELAAINKDFGPGTVARMNDAAQHDLDVVSSGILPLDLALGCGGYPRGRIVEIFGGESVGKSSLALMAVASFQKDGGKVLYLDSEHALDPEYARALGVNVDDLLISQPDTGEQTLEVMRRLVDTGELALVVVDSVAALTPKAEIEGEMGDASVGAHARLMSQAMRKLVGPLSKRNVASIWINQQREKIGVIYGSPLVTTGGKALKFYSSIRLEVFRGELKKEGDENTANRTRIKVVKNKCGPPFHEVKCDLEYGRGFPRENCVLDAGIDANLVEQHGSWFTYEGEQLGQGRTKAIAHLQENPQLVEEIEKRIRDAIFGD